MFVKDIMTEKAPAPIGPYSQAIKLSDFVYLSGQLGVDALTGDLVGQDVKSQTHQAMQNILSILESMGLGLRHVVKTTVYLRDMDDFGDFNAVYGEYFEKPYPARSCVAVAGLPKGAAVEIECLVIDTLPYEQQAQGCGGCQGDCGCQQDGGCGQDGCGGCQQG